MPTMSFENLQVYKMSEELADDVWSIVVKWDSFSKDTVGRQIVKAADSIGANIAEGTGRGSYQDNRRFFRIARGSLYEARHWLRRAFQRQLLTSDQIATLRPMVDNLSPMLNAYL